MKKVALNNASQAHGLLLRAIITTLLLAIGYAAFTFSRVEAACSAQNPDLGSATQTINIAASGTYRVWSRIMATSSSVNSYLLEVDGGTCITVGDSSIATNTWTWVDYQGGNTSSKINLSLTAGTHTIKMIGREAGAKLDKVIFTADSSCVPTGNGDNCVVVADTTPPTVTMTAPADNSTVSGTITLSASASDASGISKVEFRNNNQLILTETTSPYSHTLDTTTLADGAYTLSARAFDNAGNVSTDSIVRITVDNQPEGLPDLVIQSVSMTPASPVAGDQVRFSMVVKNQGTAATPLGTKHGAKFQINGTTVSWHSNNTTTSIPAGGTYTFTANDGPTGSPYWPAVEGTHTLTAFVDDLRLITETDDANNTSQMSLTVSKPPDTQAPSVPTGVTATANTATKVTVSWQPSTDNVAVTGYWITRNGVGIALVGVTTSYVDTTVLPSTNYTYAVAATDAAWNGSAFSSAVSVQTPAAPDTQAPTAPTGLVVIALSSSQINMGWVASTDNVGVKSYDIYRSKSGGTATRIATVTTTSFANTGLSANTAYTYYVVAKDAAGNASPQSTTGTATTFASADRGNIFGYIRDAGTNTNISGAIARVNINGRLKSSKTGSSGAYLITNIPAAPYTFSYSANNYQSRQADFTILPSTTIPGNISLQRL